MAVLDFLSRYIERRSVNDPQHWIVRLTESLSTKSGTVVTADTALSTSAVFACVRVLSETIASLPLMIYRRRADGGKEPYPDHPLYTLLHDSPNLFQTSYEFREMQVGHCALRGNAYAYIQRYDGGEIAAIVPLNPVNMTVEIDGTAYNPKIVYRYKQDNGQEIIIPAANMWHVKGISSDGITGMSPLQLGRETIGLAIAAESHGSVYFRNGAKASGIVKLPGRLKEDAKARLTTSVNESISGDNKFRVLVFEEGMDWTSIGISNEDSQFLETREFQVQEIARMFRVPAVLIGHPDQSATYASVEQQMLSFVTHTIRPWLVRIEQSISKNLFTEADRDSGVFAEFKIEGLLRGDTLSRYNAYALAITNRWMNPNEVRALENMNPREGGDEYGNPNIDVTASQEENNAASDTEEGQE